MTLDAPDCEHQYIEAQLIDEPLPRRFCALCGEVKPKGVQIPDEAVVQRLKDDGTWELLTRYANSA